VCSTKNENINQIFEDYLDFKSVSRNLLNDRYYQRAYANDSYIIGLFNRWTSTNNIKIKIIIKNSSLHEMNFFSFLKEIKEKYNLTIVDVHLNIALDTDTNIIKLFNNVISNKNYKIAKLNYTKEFQEDYDTCLIGSKQDYFFKMYNKTKQLKHFKKNLDYGNVFSNKTVYRMELFLKPKNCKDIQLNVFELQNINYLQKIFKTFFQNRLQVKVINPNDKTSSRWKKEYIFNIDGDITKIDKKRQNKDYKINHIKTITKSLVDLYSKHHSNCFIDSINEIRENYDIESYVKKICDKEILEILIKSKERKNEKNKN